MNYIWTYWANPANERVAVFDLSCLALSAAFVSQYANNKTVYTDSYGARQIEKYQIPIDVVCTLDDLQNENRDKYALAKIDTYSKVESPCTHIDYDVFLTRQQKETSADFCCQTLELGGIYTKIYKTISDCFVDEGGVLPREIQPYYDIAAFCGYNMGYLQIRNVEFLNKYAAASRLVFPMMKTVHYGDQEHCGNTLPEQYLFYCMATSENISVDTLFPDEPKWTPQERDKHHGEQGYVHFMGKKGTHKRLLLESVLRKLNEFNPSLHDALIAGVDWDLFFPPINKPPIRDRRGMQLNVVTYPEKIDLQW